MSAADARMEKSLAGRLLAIIGIGVAVSLVVLLLTKDLAMAGGSYLVIVLMSYVLLEGF